MWGESGLQRQDMVAQLNIQQKRKPGRKSGVLDFEVTPKNEYLEQIAVKTHSDEDIGSYTIVLEDGSTWKDGDLKLSKPVDVERDGSSFRMEQALDLMLSYFEELREKGHLL